MDTSSESKDCHVISTDTYTKGEKKVSSVRFRLEAPSFSGSQSSLKSWPIIGSQGSTVGSREDNVISVWSF